MQNAIRGRQLGWTELLSSVRAAVRGLGTFGATKANSMDSHSLPPTTASPAIELMMNVANTSQEIGFRLTAHAYAGIHDPQLEPQLQEAMRELLFILDETGETEV
jgi:hypothetical protein